MLEEFLSDLEVLRADLDEAPRTDVVIRFRRRFFGDGLPGLAGVAAALMKASDPAEVLLDESELTVFLYRAAAPTGSKPFIAFPMDPTAEVEAAAPDGAPAWRSAGRPSVGRRSCWWARRCCGHAVRAPRTSSRHGFTEPINE